MEASEAQETRKVRKWFVIIIGSWMVAAFVHDNAIAQSRIGTWPDGASIEHNPGGAPADVDMARLIDYAAWSWGQRSGQSVRHGGSTDDEGFSTSGRITIIWRDSAWFSENGTGPFQRGRTRAWYYRQTGYMAGAVVTLNSTFFTDSSCGRMTLMHELGHALGISGHSEDPHDVMYRYGHCRYTLSASDARILAPTGNSACHAELTRDGHIYIPMIDGFAAYLEHNGDLTWKLSQLVESDGNCSSSTVTRNSDVILRDLRGVDRHYRAELEWMGDDTWRLRWAD